MKSFIFLVPVSSAPGSSILYYSDPIAYQTYFLWSLYLNVQMQVYLGY